MPHVHVAVDGTALHLTLPDGRLQVDLPTGALDTSGALAEALRQHLGDLRHWPRPPATLDAWWWGGAWFRCLPEKRELAHRLLTSCAPDLDTVQRWEQDSIDLGLPATADPDLDLVLGCDPLPDELISARNGRLRRHPLVQPDLLDPEIGLVRAVHGESPIPGLPTAFRLLHAALAHTERGWPAWQCDRLAPAPSWVDEQERPPTEAVLASAVAHLSGPDPAPRSRLVAGVAELSGARLTPDDLGCTDPSVVALPDCPLQRWHPDQAIRWRRGRRVADDAPVWVPARWVHTLTDPLETPVTNFHNLAGMGAASTRTEAIERALSHVVGTDAVARWWRDAAAAPPSRLEIPGSLAARWTDTDLQLELWQLPTSWRPVVLAVVVDEADGLLAAGHACGDAAAAAAQALQQLVSMRDLASVDSSIRAAAATPLLPHQSDRRYLDAAPPRPDHPRCRPAAIDPMIHLQLGLDPRLQQRVRDRLVTDAGGGAVRGITTEQAVAVDTTPEVLTGSGWHAARVLLPGALRLDPAAFPVGVEGVTVPEVMPWPGW